MLVDLPAQAQAPSRPVVEHLRLRVPGETRAAWLEAEQEIWQPWLCRQKGFLGRDHLLGSETGRGRPADPLVQPRGLDWHSRSGSDRTQERFEARARQALGRWQPQQVPRCR